VTASGFWIGVEAMTASVLTAAATHPRPVFCGRLAPDNPLQAAVEASGARAEWHDIALDNAVGQGYLLDLMRQRAPVEQVVWALPPLTTGQVGCEQAAAASLDTMLATTREITESLIAVLRGAESVLEAGVGAGVTVLCEGREAPMTPLARAVMAFVEAFVTAESERWAALGLSLTLASADSIK